MGQSLSAADERPVPSGFWRLTLGSVGVVYGDIGTSPLYSLREALHGAARDGILGEGEVIGIVSLLLWTLTLIVSFKYVVLMLRADNHGEGGTLSLLALAQRATGRRTPLLLALGVAGAALFYGDAAITPAISVLSAVEGLHLVAPWLDAYVLPMSVAILVALFAVQRRGTSRVSALFGPVTLVWFVTLAALGASHVLDRPDIFRAIDPRQAAVFLMSHGFAALAVMGSVFLAVTGAEALYADMGHFGRGPIRVAWSGLVFPALAMNYLGQGSLVLARPEAAENSFFLLAPAWFLPGLVLLATVATVVASQAVITGAYSLTRQAVQLGLLPRFEVRHMSEDLPGQIYMPKVNRLLLVAVISLALLFGNSSALAGAYGIAVTGTMIVTSLLAYPVMRRTWRWPAAAAVAVLAPLLVVEAAFLFANLTKFVNGGFVPVLMALALGLAMAIWMRGLAITLGKIHAASVPLPTVVRSLARSNIARVPGTAVFLAANPEIAPAALLHNLKHNHVLHERNIVVHVSFATTPQVPESERLTIEPIGDDFIRIRMSCGYMEEPNITRGLALARSAGVKFDIMSTSFFLSRRSLRVAPEGEMPRWQAKLFMALNRTGANATNFYRLPSNRVVELGQQVAI